MSGHSKWANIQHRKGRQDEKRGKIFAKISRNLIVTAREGGGDPATNAKVAQSDALPVCGQALTWQWNPGDKIEDAHRLSIAPDAPPGEYRLYAGLYRVETGERVPVLDAEGNPTSDFVDLGEITVAAPE